MKKRIKKAGLAALFLLLATSRIFAQSAGVEWEGLVQETSELYRSGNYERSLVVAEKALKVAEKNTGPGHPSVATSLNNLAGLYVDQRQYTEAELLYKRALSINEKALGLDHPSVATNLNNLAELYHSQGRFAEAEPFYNRALAIYEKVLGPEHPNIATVLNNLANLYRNTNREQDALELEKEAKRIEAVGK
tara:strand:- start:788 stop:1363 length:576 start_codon:yes stop_codon:yes gene_type:complete